MSTLMPVRFSSSYVERLFAEKNMSGLYHLINVTERNRDLPEEFWLFARVMEWVGSARSGVWQYYEGLPDATYERLGQALDRFGLAPIAGRYRSGRAESRSSDQGASLDEWIDQHEQEIESAVLDLISRKECLTGES